MIKNFKKIIYNKIKQKKAIIGIIGLGYVGLPLALLMAKKGFNVVGYDIDKTKINKIKNKKSYLERISNNQIKTTFKKNKFFSNFENIHLCDVLIICVPTPLKNKSPNLEFIKNTVSMIKNKLRNNQLLILESTSYPGTTRDLIVKNLEKKFTIGKNFFVGFSSERINPGYNENFIHKIPKVVSGYSANCLKLVDTFYKNFFEKTVKAKNLETAELSKLLENIYRSVNIGFVNEMKFITDKMNLDIYEVLKISSTKPFGFIRFDPGPGIGGHCIPIDPVYLSWKSKQLGMDAKFINLSGQINLKVLSFIYNKINKIRKKINKSREKFNILILGIGYKKNIDDLRESSSLKLINLLFKNKYKKISYSDPHIKYIKSRNFEHKIINIKLSKNNLKKFDLAVLMTDHDKFKYDSIYDNSKFIIDTRGKYKIDSKVIRG